MFDSVMRIFAFSVSLKTRNDRLPNSGTKPSVDKIRIYLAILAKLLKLQRFDSINYLPSVRE